MSNNNNNNNKNKATMKTTNEKKSMSKEDLRTFMIDQVNQGYSVPAFVRGGGSFWIETEEDVENFFADDDYLDICDNLTNDDLEFAEDNFKSWLRDDYTDDMQIVVYQYNTGYNEENFDKFVCVW